MKLYGQDVQAAAFFQFGKLAACIYSGTENKLTVVYNEATKEVELQVKAGEFVKVFTLDELIPLLKANQ